MAEGTSSGIESIIDATDAIKLDDSPQQHQPASVDLTTLDPSAAVESLRRQLTSLNLDSRGNKRALKSRLQYIKKHGLPTPPPKPSSANHHVETKKNRGGGGGGLRWLLVIDFEATCEAPPPEDVNKPRTINFDEDPGSPEIIEFPIVLVDLDKGNIKATFQSYVRPVQSPILSEFCTQLTGITQSQVDQAPVFNQVLDNVNAWLDQNCTDFKPPISGNEVDAAAASSGRQIKSPRSRVRNWSIVTDGRADLEKFLTRQLELSGIPYPDWSLGPYLESRALFAKFSKSGRGTLQQQLKWCGLEFEGREHSGLDDAVNIARIVLNMHERGAKVEANRFMEKNERNWLRSHRPWVHRKV